MAVENFMNAIPIDQLNELSKARRRVEAYCQSLVDAGAARWAVNSDGDTELHLESGEAYLFGELGITRLNMWWRNGEPENQFIQ
jgi:hypothetical protein